MTLILVISVSQNVSGRYNALARNIYNKWMPVKIKNQISKQGIKNRILFWSCFANRFAT